MFNGVRGLRKTMSCDPDLLLTLLQRLERIVESLHNIRLVAAFLFTLEVASKDGLNEVIWRMGTTIMGEGAK